jgi:hypothetical protein
MMIGIVSYFVQGSKKNVFMISTTQHFFIMYLADKIQLYDIYPIGVSCPCRTLSSISMNI